MNSDDTKTALRNLVNLTIKGDPDNEAQKIVSDVLQAKMQARITGVSNAAASGEESSETADENA